MRVYWRRAVTISMSAEGLVARFGRMLIEGLVDCFIKLSGPVLFRDRLLRENGLSSC